METYDRDSRAVLYCSALFWGRCAGPARKNDNLLPRFTVPTALRVHNPRPAVVGLPQTCGGGAQCPAERAKKVGAFKSRTHPTPSIGRRARTRYHPIHPTLVDGREQGVTHSPASRTLLHCGHAGVPAERVRIFFTERTSTRTRPGRRGGGGESHRPVARPRPAGRTWS